MLKIKTFWKPTQCMRLTFEWDAPLPSCWPLWSWYELYSQSTDTVPPAGYWAGQRSPWTSDLNSSNPLLRESLPLGALLAHRTNATLLQQTDKNIVLLNHITRQDTNRYRKTFIVPALVEASSRLPLWMTRPPWKSCRKQGGSFPWGTTTFSNKPTKTKAVNNRPAGAELKMSNYSSGFYNSTH